MIVQMISTVGVLVELLGLVADRLAVLDDRVEHHAEHDDEDHHADPDDERVQVVDLPRDRRDRRLQVPLQRRERAPGASSAAATTVCRSRRPARNPASVRPMLPSRSAIRCDWPFGPRAARLCAGRRRASRGDRSTPRTRRSRMRMAPSDAASRGHERRPRPLVSFETGSARPRCREMRREIVARIRSRGRRSSLRRAAAGPGTLDRSTPSASRRNAARPVAAVAPARSATSGAGSRAHERRDVRVGAPAIAGSIRLAIHPASARPRA